jgi:rhodanese-related sulfurtransferase
MNPKKFITVAIVLVSILTGCSTGSDSANLSAAEFLVKSQEPGVITLDVRTAEEFRSGFIAKSLNINVESGSFDSEIANLDKSATYAVYCRSGRRSQVAIDKMRAAGFTSLFNLGTGINDWNANGLPLVVK